MPAQPSCSLEPRSAPPPGRTRLLYLGFAFPPGVQSLYPGVNPAGHGFETPMATELRRHFDLRTVGVLPIRPPAVTDADPASGIAHDLILLEKPPELIHRYRSLTLLKVRYQEWSAGGWVPEVVLAYNLSPIYSQFLIWLRRQPHCPRLALLLLDSPNLGQRLPWLKRFRRRFKPMYVADSDMIRWFDACIGLSRATEEHFRSRQIPFLWMPGGCSPARIPTEPPTADLPPREAPIRFGYFGALANHAGVMPLVEAFLAGDNLATLEICGYGRLGDALAELGRRDSRLRYHGLLPTPADCLRFGQTCDVLVNPRPPGHGNENNFPSKLFEYALTGRAILTTGFGGMREVLGPDAFYLEETQLASSLAQQLKTLSRTPRTVLREKGRRLQQRITSEYSWSRQVDRMTAFLRSTVPNRD